MRSRPPGRSTRTTSRSACARPPASRMLLIARLLTTTSNDADANGRSRASASASSTWSRTPLATALRSAAARLLPLWSRRRRTSAPTARPRAPGEPPASTPRRGRIPHPGRARRPAGLGRPAAAPRSRACPARWNTGSSPPTPRPRPVVRGNPRWRPPASPGHLSGCRDRRAGRRPAQAAARGPAARDQASASLPAGVRRAGCLRPARPARPDHGRCRGRTRARRRRRTDPGRRRRRGAMSPQNRPP